MLGRRERIKFQRNSAFRECFFQASRLQQVVSIMKVYRGAARTESQGTPIFPVRVGPIALVSVSAGEVEVSFPERVVKFQCPRRCCAHLRNHIL